MLEIRPVVSYPENIHPPSVTDTLAVPSLDASKPRLLDQVRIAIQTRHYSRRTEKTYSNWIKQFILFHNKTHPQEMVEKEVNRFLSHLAGSFSNCLEIVTLNDDGSIDDDGWYCYAPNVGLVKAGFDVNLDGSGGNWKKLISYTVN